MKKMLLTAIFAVMATAGSFAQRTPHAIGVHFGGSTMDFEYQYHFNKKNFLDVTAGIFDLDKGFCATAVYNWNIRQWPNWTPRFATWKFWGGFGGGFDFGDLGDIFGDIFGGGFGGFGGSARQANPNAPRKGQDIRVRITLSFDEAVHGCKKNITITRQQECTECHGSGCAAGTSPETCPDCGGRGFVIRQQRTPFGVMQTQQPCSRCGGKGKLVKNPCKVCHGSGKVATKKTLEVSIPMGIDDDQSFALRGMGDAGANGGPSGDVIVMVTVRPDPLFQRDGYDVWVTVPITYSQAVLGDSITVPSIDGKVEYTVPEGTQSGTTFRLRGKGIQYLNGRGRGDMYVKCEVEIPKKLNKAQRDALKKFEGTLKEENYEKRKGFFKKLKDMFA